MATISSATLRWALAPAATRTQLANYTSEGRAPPCGTSAQLPLLHAMQCPPRSRITQEIVRRNGRNGGRGHISLRARYGDGIIISWVIGACSKARTRLLCSHQLAEGLREISSAYLAATWRSRSGRSRAMPRVDVSQHKHARSVRSPCRPLRVQKVPHQHLRRAPEPGCLPREAR